MLKVGVKGFNDFSHNGSHLINNFTLKNSTLYAEGKEHSYFLGVYGKLVIENNEFYHGNHYIGDFITQNEKAYVSNLLKEVSIKRNIFDFANKNVNALSFYNFKEECNVTIENNEFLNLGPSSHVLKLSNYYNNDEMKNISFNNNKMSFNSNIPSIRESTPIYFYRKSIENPSNKSFNLNFNNNYLLDEYGSYVKIENSPLIPYLGGRYVKNVFSTFLEGSGEDELPSIKTNGDSIFESSDVISKYNVFIDGKFYTYAHFENGELNEELSSNSNFFIYDDGDGSANDPLLISTPTQFDYFAKMQSFYQGTYENSIFKKLHYKLVQDIDLTNIVKFKSSSIYNFFYGVLDGNGNKITGINNKDNIVIFSYAYDNATFKNLIIDTKNIALCGSSGVKDTSQETSVLFENVNVSSEATLEVKAGDSFYISNPMSNVIFRNCSNAAIIISETSAGCFLGYSGNSKFKLTFDGCVFEGTLTAQSEGMLIGDDQNLPKYINNITVNNCVNKGTISGKTASLLNPRNIYNEDYASRFSGLSNQENGKVILL